MSLAEPRIQRFLATKEVVVLADTQKVRNLRRDPRVCVVAESVSESGAVCGVTVQGRAEFLSHGSERRALAERFLAKYDPRLERL
jgi:nitroimidazol reductase NimA-like FMN-containing flavoprotein (pyridoxamine 5'-phosphate oxidase superfamily)